MFTANELIIDLIAEATWIACLTETAEGAEAFAHAANTWVALHPFQLAECPFEEHVPQRAFYLSFEAAEYGERWACYVDCSWVLKPRLQSIRDAMQEAERCCDVGGPSSLFLEWLVFGDEDLVDELPDGRPLFIFDPELRICVVHQREVDEYRVCGGFGTIRLEKLETRAFREVAE